MKKNLQSNILVIGDIMLDQYWFGEVKRISPEAPVPILRVLNDDFRPGGAANVAFNISHFHSNVSMAGLSGTDSSARTLIKILNKSRVNCHFIQDKTFKTTKKLRILSKSNNQQLIRVDDENNHIKHTKNFILKHYFKYIDKADLIVLSDYAKGSLNYVKDIISYCQNSQKKVLVDPKGNDFSKYTGATILTPNFIEFKDVVGSCETDHDINSKGRKLLEKLQLEYLLITLGEKGMKLLSKNNVFDLKSIAREVYDVSGAGDTVISVLASSMANGMNIQESVAYANAAAGVVVGKVGTAPTNKKEVDSYLKNNNLQDKIISKSNLKNVINNLKKDNKKIVMTNGCFDILHPGHISYLFEAKKLGHILIVAVNSDSSVKKLKGKDRPINGLISRMQVLSGLGIIDYVISFDEKTPLSLYKYLLPNIIVKGGDYKKEDVVGYSLMKQTGGSVKILNFLDGYSTSEIIKRMSPKDK